jgi:hypothetical protein
MINALLSECIWGAVPVGKPPGTYALSDWRILSPEPSTTAPATHGLALPAADTFAVTYGEFVENLAAVSRPVRKGLKVIPL